MKILYKETAAKQKHFKMVKINRKKLVFSTSDAISLMALQISIAIQETKSFFLH